MENPLLSIIIPMYNSGSFIEKTVRNLFSAHANNKNFEIILIDDGSNDDTRFICESAFREFENVHYFFKKNSGVADSRNLGVNHANGKYLFFHDHDDLFNADNLAEILDILEKSQSDLLLFESSVVENCIEKPLCVIDSRFDNKQLNNFDIENIFKTLFGLKTHSSPVNKVGQIWTLVVKKDFVISNSIKFVIRCDYEDDFTFILNCLTKDTCLISAHKVNIYKWIIYPNSESHGLKYSPDYIDKVNNLLSFIGKSIDESKYRMYKNECVSNIEWKKTRDYLILFGRGTNENKTFERFIYECKKHCIRQKMIQKTTFKKSLNQIILINLFRFRLYKLCFKAITK